MGGGSGRDGGELRSGRGFQQEPPTLSSADAVISVFFLSLPSITPKDSQEMNFKATPWDAHRSQDWEWWGEVLQPPSSLFLQDGGLEGSAGQDTLRGCRGAPSGLVGTGGVPTVY